MSNEDADVVGRRPRREQPSAGPTSLTIVQYSAYSRWTGSTATRTPASRPASAMRRIPSTTVALRPARAR